MGGFGSVLLPGCSSWRRGNAVGSVSGKDGMHLHDYGASGGLSAVPVHLRTGRTYGGLPPVWPERGSDSVYLCTGDP